MKIFADAARYYDILYRDKDYAAEAEFIHALIGKYAPNSQQILELGAGTGGHAQCLAELGLEVHGVEPADAGKSPPPAAGLACRSLPEAGIFFGRCP